MTRLRRHFWDPSLMFRIRVMESSPKSTIGMVSIWCLAQEEIVLLDFLLTRQLCLLRKISVAMMLRISFLDKMLKECLDTTCCTIEESLTSVLITISTVSSSSLFSKVDFSTSPLIRHRLGLAFDYPERGTARVSGVVLTTRLRCAIASSHTTWSLIEGD
jgi:hypothetical protein